MARTHMVKKNELYGLIDDKGNQLLEPAFLNVGDKIACGLIPAQSNQNNLWGYIDLQGRWIIQPQYSYAEDFVEELGWAAVCNDKDEKWGIIDTNGRWIMEPKHYEICNFAANGTVQVFKQNDIYRIYDVNRQEWSFPSDVYFVNPHTSAALVVLSSLKSGSGIDGDIWPIKSVNGLWGYWNRKKDANPVIIPPKYKAAYHFVDGIAIVQSKDNGLFGMIDKSGEWVAEPVFMDLEFDSKEECMFGRAQGENSLWGVINRKGEWVVKPKYSDKEDVIRFLHLEFLDEV